MQPQNDLLNIRGPNLIKFRLPKSLGEKSCADSAVQIAVRTLSENEIKELSQSAHRMPGWLTKKVRLNISCLTG